MRVRVSRLIRSWKKGAMKKGKRAFRSNFFRVDAFLFSEKPRVLDVLVGELETKKKKKEKTRQRTLEWLQYRGQRYKEDKKKKKTGARCSKNATERQKGKARCCCYCTVSLFPLFFKQHTRRQKKKEKKVGLPANSQPSATK